MTGLNHVFIDTTDSAATTSGTGGGQTWRRVDPPEQTTRPTRGPHAPTNGDIDPLAIWSEQPVIASSFSSPILPEVAEEPVEASHENDGGVSSASMDAAQPDAAQPDADQSGTSKAADTPHMATENADSLETTFASTSPSGADRSDESGFAPAWEVDAFRWPREAEKLFQAEATYFGHAGDKLVAASQQGLCVLGVAGARPGEGATTTAVCLARAAAQSGARVALFDGNATHPELGDRLGLDFAPGWQDAAKGEQPLEEAAVKATTDAITLFPLAKKASAKLEGEDLAPIIRAVAAHFDLLVIDAGDSTEACNSFLRDGNCLLDAAIVVRDVRYTSESEAAVFACRLKDAGVKAVGIAENFTQPRAQAAAA